MWKYLATEYLDGRQRAVFSADGKECYVLESPGMMQAFQKNTSFIFPNLKGKFVLPNQDFLSIVTIHSSKSDPPISHFHCWSRLASKCVQICFTVLMLTCLRWMGSRALLRSWTVAQAAYIEQTTELHGQDTGKGQVRHTQICLGEPN